MTTLDRKQQYSTRDIPARERYRIFRTSIPRKVLVFDGGMGTGLQEQDLTEDKYGGESTSAHEFLCVSYPESIIKIHDSYLDVGSDIIETNSFQGSSIKQAEHNLENRTEEINRAAAMVARNSVDKFYTPDWPRFVAGSVGPTGYLPSSADATLGNIPLDKLKQSLYQQCKALVLGDGDEQNPTGVDLILIETGQDLLELKQGVIAVQELRDELGLDIPLIIQFTLANAGKMLLGSDEKAALGCFLDLPIDVIGINCSTGPEEMREAVRYLGENAPMWVSCLPNAGLPEEVDGHAHYHLEPEVLADAHREFVGRFKVSMVGGCCGTTPAHIKAVIDKINGWKPSPRPTKKPLLVASGLEGFNIDEQIMPVIVGERLNSQGSRKAKKFVLDDDMEGLYNIAREQVEAGAAVLDVNLAVTERDDEDVQMTKIVKLLNDSIPCPLMIDSTETHVAEAALKLIPGRPIINSINFESGEKRARDTFKLLKKYGGMVVALTIDEDGMALEPNKKVAVAKRLAALAKNEYSIDSDRLLFDVLTFTLATGEEEYRHSAIKTLEGISRVKKEVPGCWTVLGISNVSFGFGPAARKALNSVFLYHAVRAGLDFAIVHAGAVIPYQSINARERELSEDLVFNKQPDALEHFIDYFEKKKATSEPVSHPQVMRTPEEGLHHAILHRVKDGVEDLIDKAIENRDPRAVLNDILLPAMKEVGDKMATGEMILPFVLQAAEVMKAAVKRLENYMDKTDSDSLGKIVLATVYGDVHDIGKNLVKTILSNNGYTVYDLGKQVPNAAIIAKAKEVNADMIGLSALLVTTSRHMESCVEDLHRQGLNIPVIIGGAAINRSFARRISWIGSDKIYPPGVYYAKDAFAGLKFIQGLKDEEEREELFQMAEEGARTWRERRDRKLEAEKEEALEVREVFVPTVSRENTIPQPAFWGTKVLEPTDVRNIYPLIDKKVLYKLNWAVRGTSSEEYNRLIKGTFEPLFEDLKAEARIENWLLPAAVYGFFPCNSDGEEVVIFNPFNGDPLKNEEEIGRFTFPRQKKEPRSCLSDYFRPVDSGERDVLALQVVTMGHSVTDVVNSFTQAGEYSKGFFLHGLSVETTEAFAEYLHRIIRDEMGIERGQGHRYSFGYSSCPDLSQQTVIFKLLDAQNNLGTRLTEDFQIIPEQSTSAFIIHHPDCKYFNIEEEGLQAVLRSPLE